MSAAGERPPPLDHLVPVPVHTGSSPAPAHDIAGHDLDGRPVHVAVSVPGCWTLLLFVTATCEGCRPLVAACVGPSPLGLGPSDRVVVVAKDVGTEDASALRTLTAPLRTAVMEGGDRGESGGGRDDESSDVGELRVDGAPARFPAIGFVASGAAWRSYRVLGAPFSVLVDGDLGVVATEGVAWSAGQVAADVARRRTAAAADRLG